MSVLRRRKELRIEPIDVIEAVEREPINYLGKYRMAIIVYSFDEMEGGDVIEMEIQPPMIGAMLSGCTRSS